MDMIKRDMAYLVLPFTVEILYFLFYGPVNIFIFILQWRHTYQSFRAISRSIVSSKGIHQAILAANWSLKLHRDCHLQTSVQFYIVSVHLFLMNIHWWSITGGSLRHELCAIPVGTGHLLLSYSPDWVKWVTIYRLLWLTRYAIWILYISAQQNYDDISKYIIACVQVSKEWCFANDRGQHHQFRYQSDCHYKQLAPGIKYSPQLPVTP